MPVQVEQHKSGTFGALRLRNPQKKMTGDCRKDTCDSESSASAHDKSLRSKEWRIACRRFTFIFDPFKRRAKSADPCRLSAMENSTKNSPSVAGSHTSFPQPPLIASHVNNDKPNKTQRIQLAPVNITGVVFERYKRSRGTGALAPVRQSNVCCSHEESPALTRWLANPQCERVPSTRPASFHPTLPQNENAVTYHCQQLQQKQNQHNPHSYQHIHTLSDITTGGNALSEQRKQTNGSLHYQTFHVQSVIVTNASNRTESNSLIYDSLYDIPPSLTPYPCPTYKPENTNNQPENGRQLQTSLRRKRSSRPSSIEPLLTRLSLCSRKPLNPITTIQPNACCCSTQSQNNSELVQQAITRPLDSKNTTFGVERLMLVPTSTDVCQSLAMTKTNHDLVLDGGTTSFSEESGYSSNCRHQSLEGSAAVCQVTVCHSSPKLCVTVAEPLTQRPNSSSMRPQSIFLDRSDRTPPLNNGEMKHTLHPKMEPPISCNPQHFTIFHQRKSSTQMKGSADLDLALCSNAASASIRQRRGRESDRSTDNPTFIRSTRAHSQVLGNETTGISDLTSKLNKKGENGTVEHKLYCACETTVPNAQRLATSCLIHSVATTSSRFNPQLANRKFLPNGDRKQDASVNGHIGMKHRLSTLNRNSWSTQSKVNRLACRVHVRHSVGTDETLPANSESDNHQRTNIDRPASVVLVPSPVCLPPPVGTRVFSQEQTTFKMNTLPLNTTGFSNGLLPEGLSQLPTWGSRRYRAPNMRTLRPPRPPMRTTSLVRGGGRDSRESSCTPPTDIRAPIISCEKTSSQSSVTEALSSPSVQDISMSAPIFYSSARMTLSDTSVDPQDRLADSEVEQNVTDRDSMWWLNLLPYKPSNLPTNLADRLRQRNSLCLARCSPNSRLSNSSLPITSPHLFPPQPHSQTGLVHSTTGRETIERPGGFTLTPHLMTQSLYEQRDSTDSVYSDHLSPDPTPTASRNDLLPSRPGHVRLSIRPSSLYIDKPDPHPILMPSLAHLGSTGTSANLRGSHENQLDRSSVVNSHNLSLNNHQPPTEKHETIDDSLSILSRYSNNTALPDAIFLKSVYTNKTDSPLLGQYYRLLNLHTTTTARINGSAINTRELRTPSAETPPTPV